MSIITISDVPHYTTVLPYCFPSTLLLSVISMGILHGEPAPLHQTDSRMHWAVHRPLLAAVCGAFSA